MPYAFLQPRTIPGDPAAPPGSSIIARPRVPGVAPATAPTAPVTPQPTQQPSQASPAPARAKQQGQGSIFRGIFNRPASSRSVKVAQSSGPSSARADAAPASVACSSVTEAARLAGAGAASSDAAGAANTPPPPSTTTAPAPPTARNSSTSASQAASSTAAVPSAAKPTTGTARNSAPARSPQPQFSHTDPNSPYAILIDFTTDELLQYLDEILMIGLNLLHWPAASVTIPPPPQTPAEAAALQAAVEQLTDAGCTQKALCWQCQVVMYHILFLPAGTEHPETLTAMYRLNQVLFLCGRQVNIFCQWLLPRAARAWGLSDPRVRQLVLWGVDIAWQLPAAEIMISFENTLRNVALHLPGGLRIGMATMAPIHDYATYTKHVDMWHEAHGYHKAGQYARARSLLERCHAYFASIGPHWLASARKARVTRWLAMCAEKLDGPAAAKQILLEGKRAAERELGREHKCTLELTWEYAQTLRTLKRAEQAMTLFIETLRLRTKVLGANHFSVFQSEVCMAFACMDVGKWDEAERMLASTYRRTYAALGPKRDQVFSALDAYCRCLMEQGKGTEARKVLTEAKVLGCDIGEWSGFLQCPECAACT